MNLLSHHACADHQSSEAQAGAVLPDLVGLHRRAVRVLPLARTWERQGPPDAAMAALVAGVRGHLEVDRHFHRHPLFLEMAGALHRALRAASDAPGLKRFFPAHLLSEMYFDHLLMAAQPGRVEVFYDLFDEARVALMERFVDGHPAGDREAFRRFVERFVTDRFLEDYRSYSGILERAERVLVRCRQRRLERAERVAVRRVFAAEAASYTPRVLQFIGSMRDAVHRADGAAPIAGSPRHEGMLPPA